MSLKGRNLFPGKMSPGYNVAGCCDSCCRRPKRSGKAGPTAIYFCPKRTAKGKTLRSHRTGK